MAFIESIGEVSIAFEGKMDEKSPSAIYVMISQGGLSSWGQQYSLGDGGDPTIIAYDRDLFISIVTPDIKSNVFSIIKVSIINSQLQGATCIISFNVDAKAGEMVIIDDKIHYATYIGDDSHSFVYGQIDKLGNKLYGPSMVLESGAPIIEFVLIGDRGIPTLFWFGEVHSKTYLRSASMKGGFWILNSDTEVPGSCHDLVSAITENGKYVSWISSNEGKDNVFGTLKDSASVKMQSKISSSGYNASKPTICTGVRGSFNLVWSEETGNSTELYLRTDASFEIPDIYRLNNWLKEQSDDAFVDGEEGRQELASKVESIIENISSDNLDKSTELIRDIEGNIDFFIKSASVLDAESDTLSTASLIRSKLLANMESTRVSIEKGEDADTILGGETMGGGSPESYIYDVEATLLSPTSVRISWSTSFFAVHNRISMGTTSPYEIEYDVSTMGYSHEKNINVQPNTDYQFYVKSCELYLLVLHAPYSSSVMSFKTNVTALNVTESSGLFNIGLTWQTTVSSTCTVQFGTTDQLGQYVSVSSDVNKIHHSTIITDLLSDTTYHYRIRANWTGYSGTTYFHVVEGIVDTIGFGIYDISVTSGLANVTFEDFIDFQWRTNQVSTTEVFFGTSQTQLDSNVTSSSGTNHSICLTNVTGGTIYYYKIVSTSLDDPSDSANVTGSIETSRIYGLTVQISTPQSVTISWYSSSPSATNRIRYGTGSINEHTISVSGSSTYHYRTISVNSLTEYKFQVESVISGITHTSGEKTFKTNVTIGQVSVDTGPYVFFIEWRTNVNSVCHFSFGPTTAFGSSASVTSVDGLLHSVRVDNVQNLTRYYFRIRANWTGYSGSTYYDVEYGDLETLQYGIFNLVVTSPSSGIIKFQWDTHMLSSSEVQVRPVTGGLYYRTIGSHGFNHSIMVSGLNPGVLYSYKVISVGTFNTTISDEDHGSIFVNCIYDIMVEIQDPTHVKISWKTSLDVSGPNANVIFYGTIDPTQTKSASGTSTSHYSTLTVSTITAYVYYVRSRINNYDFMSEVATFIANVDVVNVLIDPNLNETSLGWATTTRASCQFNYGINQYYGKGASITSINNSMAHSVSLTGLIGNITYYYRITAYWTGYSSSTYFDVETGSFNTDEYGIISTSIKVSSPLKGKMITEWETNFIGSSILQYGDSPSYLNRTAYGADGFLHYVEVNDINGSGVMYYRIFSEIPNNPDASDWVNGSIICNPIDDIRVEHSFEEDDDEIQMITTIKWHSITPSSFDLFFGESSVSEHKVDNVDYYGSGWYGVEIPDLQNGHNIPIFLDPNCTYMFKIVGDGFKTDILTFITNMTIFDIEVIPDFESATISWSTSMDGACSLNFGNGSLSSTVTTNSGKVHSVRLNNLKGNTNYSYRINAFGAESPSIYYSTIDGAFSTLSFGIVTSSIKGSSPSPGCLEVEWQTTLPSSGGVYYGTNPASLTSHVNVETNITHKVQILNLTINQNYYYKIVAICETDGMEVVEHNSSTAVEITSVFGVRVDVFSPTEARVYWCTTISSDRGYVEYWIDSGHEHSVKNTYRASNGTYFYADLKADRRGDGGLIPNTNYSFRIADYYTDSAVFNFETNVKISDVIIERGYDWLLISWNTNMVCSSSLEYGPTIDLGHSVATTTTQGGRSHTAFIDALNGDTRYYYDLLSYYSFNTGYYCEESGSISTRPFGIMSNTFIVVGADFLEIGWNTSEAASGVVEYGTVGNGLDHTSICQNGTWHYTRIFDLEPNSMYIFRLNSTKSHDENDVSTMNMTLITASPSISNVVATVLDHNPYGGIGKSVLFSWTTNFNGTSIVRYDDRTINSNSDITIGGIGYQHHVTVNNLTANLTYFYDVESVCLINDSYNESSPVSSVDIRLKISDVLFKPISGSTAIVSWATNYLSTSIVYISTDEGLTNPMPPFINSTETRSHTVMLSGLSLNATYYYAVLSDWTGSLYNDSIRSYDFFIKITDMSIDYNRTSAIISWRTSLESTGEVQFAACSMVNTSSIWAQSGYSSAFDDNGTTHEVVLSSLSIDTMYCFRLVSTWVVLPDFINNSEFSNFSTVLKISEVSHSQTDTSITVTWYTNFDSSSIVHYGLDQSCSSTRIGRYGISHTVKLSGLNTNTNYYISIESGDDFGSVSKSLGSLNTKPISIEKLEVYENLPSRTIINWRSSSYSTSRLEYSLDPTFATYSYVSGQTSNNLNFQATLTGLSSNNQYHFRVKCVSSSNLNDVQYLNGGYFQPPVTNDAGQGKDASNSLSTSPMRVTTGEFAGNLNNNGDTKDFYSIFAKSGQKIQITLSVGSNYDVNLYLYSPSSSTRCDQSASGGIGGTETITYDINQDGFWRFEVRRYSGTGNGYYRINTTIIGGFDEFLLNVGSANDKSIIDNLPGACLFGDSWGNPVSSNSSRFALTNATILINLQPISYQLNTDYMITFAYSATNDVPVLIFDGMNWNLIGNLIGDSQEYRTHSLLLDSVYYFDYLNSSMGTNVLIRFEAPFQLFSIHIIAYSYSNYPNTSPSDHNAGIGFGGGWSFDNGIANGTKNAWIVASIARSDTVYQLEVWSSSDLGGWEIFQQYSSGYLVIGTISYWNGIGFIQLNQGSYFDSDGSAPGIQIRLRFNSSVTNVSKLRLTPNTHCTDVGVTGDNSASSRTPGINLASTSEWSSPVNVDGRTTRYSALTNANIYINGINDDATYEINIKYKTANAASIMQCYGTNLNNYLSIASLVGDNSWHDAIFCLNQQYYQDCMAEGALNILLKVSQTGVYIDWINISVDSDLDKLIDAIEFSVGTNINDPDSDHDNVNDCDELRLKTNPINPDTDGDGLMDGGEKYSYTWSTDLFYSIPNDGVTGDPGIATLTLPSMKGQIDHVWVQVGIVHPSCTDLKISLERSCSSIKHDLAMQPQGSNGAYYGSWDIRDKACVVSDLYLSSSWSLLVDNTGSIEEGRIEYFRIMIEGSTDPLKGDSDGDGISDGEEVNLGVDGWRTNPMSIDTDDDGLNDGTEINGFFRAGIKTKADPTRADTDGDGFLDGIDIRPLGDAVVKVDLSTFKLDDTICELWGGIGGSTTPSTFFVIKSGDTTYFTSRFESKKDRFVSTGLHYYFNIDDNVSSIDFVIQAWADNVELGTGDYQLDIGTRGGKGYDHRIEYDVGDVPRRFDCDGISDGDDGRDGHLIVKIETLTLPRVNTIIVNGTDYGLDEYSGEYRYSADEQVFLFYLNCSDSKGQFVKGLNVVIVPRAVVLTSKLNYTLFNLETVKQGDPLHNASLSVTNKSADHASAHIIAIVSKNLTASKAGEILGLVTRDVNGERVGNSISITSSQLVMMHLPLDVLNYVPVTGIQNSPTGNRPVGWQDAVVNSVVDAAEFLANGIIALGTFMIDVYVTIAEIGLNFLVKLAHDVAQTVKDVAQAIVDAFMAFVDWMVDLIVNTILTPLGSFFSDALEGIGTWVHAYSLSMVEHSDKINNGEMALSEASYIMVKKLTDTELFTILCSIAIGLSIVMMVLEPITKTYTFVIDIAIPLIIAALFGAFIIYEGQSLITGAFSAIQSSIIGFIGDGLVQFESTVLSFVFSIGGSLCEFVAAACGATSEIIGFAISVIGLIIAFYELSVRSDDVDITHVLISIFGMMCCGVGLVSSIRSYSNPNVDHLVGINGFTRVLLALSAGSFAVSIFAFGTVYNNYLEE